jgi:xanthine dehydrogenase YagS FAD-binding subunit
MKLRRPSSLAEAAEAGLGNGSVALSGGVEVVPLLRDGLLTAETLVDVRDLVPRGISSTGTGTLIGAGTSLADLELAADVPEALREACRLAASPQIRNQGSIAGNLLQATRCWYWRLDSGCWLQGGDTCFAREGRGDEHAIFGNAHCASAHPSDPAAALLALGATLRTDRREMAVADLYRLPSENDRSVTALQPGELILELQVPSVEASVYLKAMDRQRYAFPLVGVAAARLAGDVRIALAGVAPVPWLLDSGDGDLGDATPVPGSAFKIELGRALVKRARDTIAA